MAFFSLLGVAIAHEGRPDTQGDTTFGVATCRAARRAAARLRARLRAARGTLGAGALALGVAAARGGRAAGPRLALGAALGGVALDAAARARVDAGSGAVADGMHLSGCFFRVRACCPCALTGGPRVESHIRVISTYLSKLQSFKEKIRTKDGGEGGRGGPSLRNDDFYWTRKKYKGLPVGGLPPGTRA